jgi:hypothetical protein
MDTIHKADMTGWHTIVTMELYRGRSSKPPKQGGAGRVHAQVNNASMARKYNRDTNNGGNQYNLHTNPVMEQGYKERKTLLLFRVNCIRIGSSILSTISGGASHYCRKAAMIQESSEGEH